MKSVTKIGIIREGKVPPDLRVPFTPEQCKFIKENFSDTDVVVQSSPFRIFKDDEYRKAGIDIVNDLSDCDIIMGIKEVNPEQLVPNKKYVFFSHTIKKQPHNKKLIKALIDKKIQMIDYECMTDEEHNRVIGFGHYAGIVGAYNGIFGYGKRYNLFLVKRASDCYDKEELLGELKKINLPNLKIIVTGNGRVANGAIELLGLLHIRRITPYEFTHYTFREPTYTQLHSYNYYETADGSEWNTQKFYTYPEKFRSTFLKYTRWCDLLVHCSFWDPRAPKMFSSEQMRSPEFGISVIADLSCDMNGPIASTLRSSSIAEPFYGYNPVTEKEDAPFANNSITVMAVDNLPCELPRDASDGFGKELIEKILPSLLQKDNEGMIERATIVKEGKLMKKFNYMLDYIT